MNWEPMTEDAVFEDGKYYLLAATYTKYKHSDIFYLEYDDGSFWMNSADYDSVEYDRDAFTHFARITNPNEDMP